MALIASAIGLAELARTTQLINKAHQFNLAPRRYREAEVRRHRNGPTCSGLGARLSGRCGDNGLFFPARMYLWRSY
jgi:predicted enzyme involved in methoxymalonyl-ACP biosynthesis